MDDAICAIATPYGTGAISIIRCSGKDCISKVNKIFKGADLNFQKPNTIHYGNIIDGNQTVDEVMVSIFKAPKSFTKEDSVEISCHGGVFITNKVLETLLKNNFRLAEPGEFTKRAFLNKRINLVQAEAVMDMINADNDAYLKAANMSLRHTTTNLINNLRDKILDIIATIEVNIDYPEYDDVEEMTNNIIMPKLEDLISNIKEVIKHSKIGQIIFHGIKTAIIGRPNVGKSSLLNMLIDEEKAIVSRHEGTTRDLVEAKLNLGNVSLNLIDTAGIRNTKDEVEQIGISKSQKLIEEAQLILLVLDSSVELTKEDEQLLKLTEDKKRIIILNKSDLESKLNLNLEHIKLSALKKNNLKELEEKLIQVTKINEFNVAGNNYVSNARHIALLHTALDHLEGALEAASSNHLIDMIQIDIKNAWLLLGEILGETTPDLLISELFSKFCLGK